MKKYLIIWAVVWIVIYSIVVKTGYPDAATGVISAAVISLFFLFKIIGSSWTGEVIEIKTETKVSHDNDGVSTHEVDYAYIKLPNGKIKKTMDLGWKVGDKLEKLRGTYKPRLVS
jgi:hypothetical protein